MNYRDSAVKAAEMRLVRVFFTTQLSQVLIYCVPLLSKNENLLMSQFSYFRIVIVALHTINESLSYIHIRI